MAKIDRLIGTKIADSYCITGEIGAGGMGRVFRAMPFDDPSQDVAIKVILRTKKLDSEDVLRFQKEAALMSRLHHPNIICFHELGLLGDSDESAGGLGSGYYIVMEIANGRNLKESLSIDSRKDLAFFFQVGLQVTAALDYTHGKNIIHRDIKPQNIVVGKAWREQRGVLVKVLDFGVARLAEAMHFASSDGEGGERLQDIAGTPMYMAPEQTPLMSAPIDHRVDLYSLGCVLYEILAGRPPFMGSTREKLMQQHVSASPEPLTTLRPDIPPIIESIVHKLLAKHPSARYQTAFGLYADLQRAKAKLQSRRRSYVDFALGLNDSFKAVSAKLDLVGREKEFESLVASYSGIAKESGRSRLSVIKGAPGTGKTRLLGEFRSYLARRKIRFISTSFSRHENILPFNALANGFNEYLTRVYKSQPHEAEELRIKIRTMLGPLAHQVAAVVPGLEPFIDPEMSGEEEEGKKGQDSDAEPSAVFNFQTFAKAFSDFTRCLATDNQPVVFIFDDMHWADEKSLELIDQFFSHNNAQRFFMIVSHRPLEEHEAPLFGKFIEKFRKLRRRFEEIDLGCFDEPTVGVLTGNMLNSAESVRPELTAYLEQKTKGNPMYLVELVRTLVAQEYINLNPKNGHWEYDLAEIQQATIPLDSVDLVLSRIQSYHEADRVVLEIAAAVGMTFQFELLLIDGSVQAVKAMKALQRAMDEGLITRTPDDEELKHLGKSFSFTHMRVREAIYDILPAERKKELHHHIALKLERSIASPGPKTIFTLAHHINQVIGKEMIAEGELAERGVRFNIAAGHVASRTSSWQSAQRYYENAYQLVKQLPESSEALKTRALVTESLADIATHQRHNSAAIKMYRELLKLGLSRDMYAVVAFKAVNLEIVGGQISRAIQALSEAMRTLKLRMPQPTAGYVSQFWAAIALDLKPGAIENGRLYQLLRSAYVQGKKDSTESDRKYYAVKLYHLGQTIFLKERPQLGLVYHHYALSECLKGRASAGSILRTVGDRAFLMAYFGFEKKSYRLLDIAIEVAQTLRLKEVFGYLLLLRTLTLDHYRAKYEEIDQNVALSLEHIAPELDRVIYAQGIVFQMYSEFLKANLGRVTQLGHALPGIIPTRNWVSPKGMAFYLFALLLEDARDAVVRKGELYLKRRAHVGGRESELFMRVIHAIVAFAKGEIDNTRKYYALALNDFLVGHKKEVLMPFEEDFIAFFAVVFPDLFMQEHRRRLIKHIDPATLLRQLQVRVQTLRGRERAVPQLVMARIEELLGGRDVKRLYDDALRAAKVSGHLLAQLFSYYWFGKYLYRSGQTKRRDYILKVQEEANRNHVVLLVELAEKTMRELEIPFESVKVQSVAKGHAEAPEALHQAMPKLVYHHLAHMCEVMGLDTGIEEHLPESMALLKRHYDHARITFILMLKGEDDPQVVYPFDAKDHGIEVLEYVLPYLNVRSSLFLPVGDAPWAKGAGGDGPIDADQTIAGEVPSGDDSAEDLDKTSSVDLGVVTDAPIQDGTGTLVLESTLSRSGMRRGHGGGPRDDLGQGIGGDFHADYQGLLMNTLVPIRYGDRNVGVLFVERIQIADGNTTACRQDLDHFGAQLGMMVHRKSEVHGVRTQLSASGADRHLSYQPGKYHLETVDWLNLWSHGTLRKNRESTWYLGLALGEGDYLLTYCRLNGPQLIRERLASQLWHHLFVVRSLALASGRNTLTPIEVREELVRLLRADANTPQLDGVSLSFTIFNAETKQATSGHFGPSRPLVLCVENEVTPHNEAVFNLANGRALRYWEVKAHLSGVHTYILPHDSSKLDAIPMEPVERSVSVTNAAETQSANLHRLMQKYLTPENVPRYYVAGVLVERDVEPAAKLSLVQ